MADELTPVQRFVLVTLMIRARALPATYFTNVVRISLKKNYRDDLRDRGLITVAEKPLVLELTEKGWGRAVGELGAEVPPRAGSAGGALYVALQFLSELIDRLDIAPADLFRLHVTAAAPTGTAAGPETSIRMAYATVASAGQYVPLAEVRAAMRTVVDETLVQMNRGADVHIIPNSQQGDLTDADREAAVRIGNQDRHLIAITP